MKKRITTDVIIEKLVVATCRDTTTSREKHIYREALRGLVRFAKSEQMLEMKANVDRLSGVRQRRFYWRSVLAERRKRAKSSLNSIKGERESASVGRIAGATYERQP
jgi:hypothetical protein